ncbi:hypothetical protein PRIPAC_95262 [Pristionchus pacificus]|nr:hypothetical protein PRIPAC_95262 [Pristionchus pacificus]|eukprot:PDM60342.1 hypothetical protein PRIPAC_54167 [Pristionchus pacificus]
MVWHDSPHFLCLPLAILACAPHTPKREVESFEEKSDCVKPSEETSLCTECMNPAMNSPAEVKCPPNYKLSFKDSKGNDIATTGERIYCTTKMRWAVYIELTVPTIYNAKDITNVQCKPSQ